ncbi:MAG TPA: hypothetical protein VKZ63_01565 [Kofleriaceae bacterium]|nr:hypothetical protein [Kofleriaceae bacterium]
MHRRQRLACMTAALAALSAACTDGSESFVIIQNQIPQEGCVIPTDLGSAFLARGRIDVAAGAGYLFTPVVQSLVTESATGMADRILFVRGADVTLSFQDGVYSDAEIADLREAGLARFRQVFSGSVFPQGTTSFGFEIIPKAMLEDLAGRIEAGGSTLVTAEIVMLASLDGGDVESEPYSYPVDVCDGCLLIDRGSCAGLPTDFQPATGGVCQPLQDGATECCTDADGNLVCPAAPEPPA